MRLEQFGAVHPLGTTVAARPELAGVIVADVLRPFIVWRSPVPPDYRWEIICRGTLQDRVVREYASGTLSFYHRITQITPVRWLVVNRRFSRYPTDVDFRLDGLGVLPPWRIGSNYRAITFDFRWLPLGPRTDPTRWFFFRTDAFRFDEDGETGVMADTDRGGAWVYTRTFQPLYLFVHL